MKIFFHFRIEDALYQDIFVLKQNCGLGLYVVSFMYLVDIF